MEHKKATAQMSTRTVRRLVEVEERQQVVNLTLNQDEAETLAIVMGSVGGDPTQSRRKHTQAIDEALASAGVLNRARTSEGIARFTEPYARAIFFKDNV